MFVDFYCLLISRHEIDTALVKRASKIAVDYKQGVLVRTLHLLSVIEADYTEPFTSQVEAGEIIDAGIASEGLVELGELFELDPTGRWATKEDKIGEVRSGDVTIFKSVGVGVQDAAISHAVVNAAKEHGVGTIIENYS